MIKLTHSKTGRVDYVSIDVVTSVEDPMTISGKSLGAQILGAQVKETAQDIVRMISLFKEQEFKARNALSVEYILAQRQHGYQSFPYEAFPRYAGLNDDGEPQVFY